MDRGPVTAHAVAADHVTSTIEDPEGLVDLDLDLVDVDVVASDRHEAVDFHHVVAHVMDAAAADLTEMLADLAVAVGHRRCEVAASVVAAHHAAGVADSAAAGRQCAAVDAVVAVVVVAVEAPVAITYDTAPNKRALATFHGSSLP